MQELLFDQGGPCYLETPRQLEDATIAMFGVPYDGTTSFRPGTRFGPDALRTVSVGLETYCPELDRDLADRAVVDMGNLVHPNGSPAPVVELIHRATTHILDQGMTPLMLGGEHSVSPGAVRAVFEKYPELALVQIDAHADLRFDYLGEKHNHACAVRRCLDFLPSDRVRQVGIRSGTREEFEEMRETGRYVNPTAEALKAAIAPLADRPIYLTIDLDVFDPAYLPGTGTPEPGGIDWPTFMSLLQVLKPLNLVAADVVELSPQLDATGCSAVLASKVVREVLLCLQEGVR